MQRIYILFTLSLITKVLAMSSPSTISCKDCGKTNSSFEFNSVTPLPRYPWLVTATNLNECETPMVLVCFICRVGWHHDIEMEQKRFSRVKYHHRAFANAHSQLLLPHKTDPPIGVTASAQCPLAQCPTRFPVDSAEMENLLDEPEEPDQALPFSHDPNFGSASISSEEALVLSFQECPYILNFALHALTGKATAISYLVATCVYRNVAFRDEITQMDRSFFLKCAEIALAGSGKSKKDMSDLLTLSSFRHDTLLSHIQQMEIENLALRRMLGVTTKPAEPLRLMPIATTPNRIRATYIEGKYSLKTVAPTPPVKILKKHALNPIVTSFGQKFLNDELDLASIPQESPYTVSALWQSAAAVSIRKRVDSEIELNGLKDGIPRLPLYLILWLDDAERMKSMRNKVSLWHLTGTISPSGPSSIYTHYLATGAKGANHDPVIASLVDDLAALKGPSANVFYYSARKQVIRPHLEPIMVLADQIERRACLSLRAGNSTFGPIFGMSANLVILEAMFRACSICNNRNRILLADDNNRHKHHHDESWRPPTISNLNEEGCPICVNWSPWLLPTHKKARMVPPKHYPVSEIPADGFIRCKELSISELKLVIGKSHQCFVAGQWSAETVHAFLMVECINNSGIAKVLKHAQNFIHANENPVAEWILKDMTRNPVLYTAWRGPAFWHLGLELVDFVNAPMHILFLGIVKKFFERVIAWNKANGTTREFSVYTRNLMECLKVLGLSWLQADTFRRDNGTKSVAVGGWISTNYVCFARVLPWFIAGMEHFKEEKAPYEQPATSPSKWTKAQNKEWLNAHGIFKGYSSLNAVDLKLFTKGFMTKVTPLKRIASRASPFHTLVSATQSLVSLISEIMQKEVDPRRLWRTDLKIKIFLTDFDIFTSYLNGIAVADDIEISEILDDDDDGVEVEEEGHVVLEEAGNPDPDTRQDGARVDNMAEDDNVEEAMDGVEVKDDDEDDIMDGGEGEEGQAPAGGIGLPIAPSTNHNRSRKLRRTICTWISSYNYSCLPYLVRDMKRFGSVRGFFEGSFMGEKFLTIIKEACAKMRRSPMFSKNLMENVLMRIFLDWMLALEKQEGSHRLQSCNTETVTGATVVPVITAAVDTAKEAADDPTISIQIAVQKVIDSVNGAVVSEVYASYQGSDGGGLYRDGSCDGSDGCDGRDGGGGCGVTVGPDAGPDTRNAGHDIEVAAVPSDCESESGCESGSESSDCDSCSSASIEVVEFFEDTGSDGESDNDDQDAIDNDVMVDESWKQTASQYQNAADASHDFWFGNPLSCVAIYHSRLGTPKYYMILKGKGEYRKCLCLTPDNKMPTVTRVGFEYQSYECEFGKSQTQSTSSSTTTLSVLEISRGFPCSGLPLLGRTGLANLTAQKHPMFCFTTPTWHIFQKGHRVMFLD
jgi:hypothetical protein